MTIAQDRAPATLLRSAREVPVEAAGAALAAASSAKPRIVVAGVGKSFNGMQVFKGVDLTIGEREIVTVVGPSGCGKTTLLRSIVGLTDYDEGDILIDGVRVDNAPREGVGMVFQNFGLFPWKTVFDNVAYGLRMAGAPESHVRSMVAEQIRRVKLTGFEKAYPYQLSGGMQQRCGLARALAIEPAVLLLDEPFGAIDAQTREILQFELLRIWEQRPLSMLFITHSIEEAVLMGDRVVVLKGRPSTVFEVIDVGIPHPRTRATLAAPRFAQVREHLWNCVMQEAQAAEFNVCK